MTQPAPAVHDRHRQLLHDHAVTDMVIDGWGITSQPNGYVVPWRDGVHDVPVLVFDKDKRPPSGQKNTWPKDMPSTLNFVRWTNAQDVLLVEGVKQHLAVAGYAPTGVDVVGMHGVDGVHKATDLAWARGRTVWVIPDGDATSKKGVREGVDRVVTRLANAGAKVHVVDLLRHARSLSDGIDDILARIEDDQERQSFLIAEVNRAKEDRRVLVQRASWVELEVTDWLWQQDEDHWIPMGGLTLLGGREGIGKTTLAFQIAARLTRGTLPGRCQGRPRSVVIAATEDSWGATVVPRLLAAGADLDRVFRVDVATRDYRTNLELPTDVADLQALCVVEDVALILLDPLTSTVARRLDTHKDAEVRQALEPISRLAHETGAAVLGLIHVTKATGSDLMSRLMGSRAFGAVARSVLFCAKEKAIMDTGLPSAEPTMVFGQIKNNLAATVRKTVEYSIKGKQVGTTQAGRPVFSSELVFGAVREQGVEDVVEASENQVPDKVTPRDKAREWLLQKLAGVGPVASASVRADAAAAGHARNTFDRAVQSLIESRQLQVVQQGRNTVWIVRGEDRPEVPAPPAQG